ncbi:MAG: hypothetical protein O7G85_03965 [Planctomycetota bacterium]|nr:hypothetical protein [Planctomycetota bacterium]
MHNRHTDSVLWKEHLYGFDKAILKCIDLEGNEVWRQRGLGRGSLSLAGGRLMIVTADGELIIAEATPQKFTELSRRTELAKDRFIFTQPVLSHGLLYCRSSQGEMACLDCR